MKTFAALALALSLSLTPGCAQRSEPEPAPTVQPVQEPGPETAPVAAAGGEAQAVDLDASFRIPQSGGQSISHTPSVVFTQDGKRMLTATSDGEIVVFEVGTRRMVKRIKFPGEGSDGVSIDASGRYAVWALKKGGVAVMEIAAEKIVARDGKLTVNWIAVAPDAKTVAVTRGKELEIRDLKTLKRKQSVPGHQARINNVVWSRDGRRLGSVAEDGRVLVYEVEKQRKFYEVKKGAAMHAMAFRPGGTHVAYGGQDNQVYQYGFRTEKEEVISKGQPYWITCLGYSPDGEMIAVGDESCDIWLYRLKDNHLTFHNKHHVECWLSTVAWAPDNETFLFGCRPNSLAGKPSLHVELSRAEAARSAEARRSRRDLLAAVDKQLAAVKGEHQRKALEELRKSLLGEEKVGGAHPGGGVLAGATLGLLVEGVDSTMDLGALKLGDGGKAPPASLDQLPKEVREMAQRHGETLQKEMKRVQSDFCVNQWKVKRK